MIYIPFIYFSLLLLYILKKKKQVDISSLITIVYIFISFFAIVIDIKQLYGNAGCIKASLDITPTILYCFLITLTIIPFVKLQPLNKGNVIPINNLKLFNWIVYFYFVVFVLFILFFISDAIDKIQNINIAELRISITRDGDDLGFSKYSGVLRYIARLTYIFGSGAMFLHVLYFYSITFLKNSSTFNNAILFSSIMPAMIGVLSLDRSNIIYWIMSFIAVAILFWPILDVRPKKRIRRVFVLSGGVFALYFSTITIARYGEQDIGSSNSLIIYAGQSFNNFCLFYEKLNLPGISFKKISPMLYSIFGYSEEVCRADLHSRTIDTKVFATFSGIMIREIQITGAILYSFIYFFLAKLIFKKKKKYSITKLFLIVIFLYVPYLGVFGIYYGSLERSLAVWWILILCFYLQKRYVIK
jgi:hypothetical protein